MHYPRKRFGQHFLHDENIIEKIVTIIAPKSEQHIVEIGPGLGALTKFILPLANQLEVVELDRDVIPALKAECAHLGNLIIHEADALKFDFTQLVNNNQPLRLIGNLPYNISTPLLFHLLTQAHVIQDMHFMLQKEVVERMAAQVGEDAYGRLSIMVQYHCQVENLFMVKPSAFRPPPKVDSAIVRLMPYQTIPFLARNYQAFTDIVRTAFNQRRKTLRNCLKNIISAQQLAALNIDANLRPEQLTLENFVQIANNLESEKASTIDNNKT